MQVLVESAHRLHRRSAYEQGAGTMDLLGAAQLVTEYRPHASVVPPALDLSPCTPNGAPVLSDGYLWPLCAQVQRSPSRPTLTYPATLTYPGPRAPPPTAVAPPRPFPRSAPTPPAGPPPCSPRRPPPCCCSRSTTAPSPCSPT